MYRELDISVDVLLFSLSSKLLCADPDLAFSQVQSKKEKKKKVSLGIHFSL